MPLKTGKPRRRRGDVTAVSAAPAPPAETLPYLSAAPAETALQGITDKTRWKKSADGSFYYGDLERTYVALGDPRAQSTEAATFTRVLELDDSTAQTFLFVMARDLAGSSNGTQKSRRLHVNELLEFKGYRRQSKGDFPPSIKREEQSRLVRLSEIWIGVNDEIKIRAGSRYKTKKIKLISRLIDLVIEAEPTGPPAVNAAVAMPFLNAPVPYAFRASLGEWAGPYRTESIYMQTVFATIGQYDATRETQRFAMRIMLALMFNNGIRTHWRLADLFDKARIDLPKDHAYRFRQYIEDALDRLEHDCLILGWEYDAALEGTLPEKRWFEKWIEWVVVIAIPGSIEAPTIAPPAALTS